MKVIYNTQCDNIEIGDVVVGNLTRKKYLIVELENERVGALNLETLTIQFSENDLHTLLKSRAIELLCKGYNIQMILGGQQL